MTTKYRQVFTVETTDPQPFVKLLYPLQHFRRTDFSEAGNGGVPNGSTTISWTAPEPIIEVPQGIGAVVIDTDGRVWVRNPGDMGAERLWGSEYGEDWLGRDDIDKLLKAGAEIKSRGVEL